MGLRGQGRDVVGWAGQRLRKERVECDYGGSGGEVGGRRSAKREERERRRKQRWLAGNDEGRNAVRVMEASEDGGEVITGKGRRWGY